MVRAVRKGASVREVAGRFGVSVGTVVHWVSQAHGKRLDRVSFTNCKPGRAWNRTSEEVEQRILSTRTSLRNLSTSLRHSPDRIYCRSPLPSVGFGGLIQTAVGGSAGRGARRTKRSGCAA